ncbi:MAG: hypothetical protein WC775_04115 [Patescibacteria group bacterium]|jgi:hypothetical protein
MASNTYGDLIWTNHALERIGQRGLNQEMAWSAVVQYDTYRDGKQSGTTEYEKRFGKSKVTAIVKVNEKGEKVVISCWIDPPYYGTDDYYKKQAYNRFQKAGFWGKFWLTIKEALGF